MWRTITSSLCLLLLVLVFSCSEFCLWTLIAYLFLFKLVMPFVLLPFLSVAHSVKLVVVYIFPVCVMPSCLCLDFCQNYAVVATSLLSQSVVLSA